MGSEGYLINQFLVRHTNKCVHVCVFYKPQIDPRPDPSPLIPPHPTPPIGNNTHNRRADAWGGEYQNRMRFPVEVVKAVRQAVGEDFIIVFRLSMLDLVPEVCSCFWWRVCVCVYIGCLLLLVTWVVLRSTCVPIRVSTQHPSFH